MNTEPRFDGGRGPAPLPRKGAPANRRRAFLGMSHSPLLGLNPIPAGVEAELNAAIAEVRAQVQAWQPDRVVLIAPDHYNGFFNELMPPLCIATAAVSVGDYLTPAGPLKVDSEAALGLADELMDGFDIALSRRMQVDHGFVQALQLMWGSLEATPPIVPIFMNAVAMPGIPRLRRCQDLGRAIGRYLDRLPGRTLLLGSGGLSHEPPVPTLAHADAAVRERITVRQTPTPAERHAKTERVMAAGRALAAGDPGMKPINPEWDRRWLDALESGDIDALLAMAENSIEHEAGPSAHESKTWLIASSAMPTTPTPTPSTARKPMPARVPTICSFRYYRAIPEIIAGYGLMLLQTAPE